MNESPETGGASRREFLLTGAAAVALSVAFFKSVQGGLGNVNQMLGRGIRQPLDGMVRPPQTAEIDPAAHILNRLTFGPTAGDYARVSDMGVEAFIEEQLAPEKMADPLCDRAMARYAEAWWEPLGEAYEEDDESLSPVLRKAALLRAVYSKRQLFEVMCEFWSDHFNIDPSKGDARFAKIADDRDVIRKHALGKFSELLRASALSPAMLWYLDGRANVKQGSDEKPNENYARELMELHTLGVHGGYSQEDVMEVARCLTGWTVLAKKDDGFSGKLLSPMKDRAKVVFRAEAHDDGAKRVLGTDIAAGGGEKDLDRVIAIVAAHSSTAKYLATKLCTRFISDEPPAPAVDAVAAAFTSSDGEIKATLRALFATPEFRASAGAKFKRPFHYVVSALRATHAEIGDEQPILAFLEQMGHAPFRFPTPDGYPQEAAHWYGTLMWRWKFALALAGGEIKGTRIRPEELSEHLGGQVPLMASMLNRQPDALEKEVCSSGTAPEPSAKDAEIETLALVLASPGFQRC